MKKAKKAAKKEAVDPMGAIIAEHNLVSLELGRKEYLRRRIEVDMQQLEQRMLELNTRAQQLKDEAKNG